MFNGLLASLSPVPREFYRYPHQQMQIEDSPFTTSQPSKETPHQPDGSFGWLAKTPTHSEWAIGDEKADELPSQLDSIVASADEHGVSLPDEFTGFIRNVGLHKHLPLGGI